MSGYLYFTYTGEDIIDRLLRAVESAGSCYHHTEQWHDDEPSCIDDIDNRARECAAEIATLRAKVAELEDENERLGQLVCDECTVDGEPTGWVENRVEGRVPCVCVTESEPYQALRQRVAELKIENHRLNNYKTQVRQAGATVANAIARAEAAEARVAESEQTIMQIMADDAEEQLVTRARTAERERDELARAEEWENSAIVEDWKAMAKEVRELTTQRDELARVLTSARPCVLAWEELHPDGGHPTVDYIDEALARIDKPSRPATLPAFDEDEVIEFQVDPDTERADAHVQDFDTPSEPATGCCVCGDILISRSDVCRHCDGKGARPGCTACKPSERGEG